MSYSTMIEFKQDGSHGEYVEFRNAWGLHARIWDVVSRHLNPGPDAHWLQLAVGSEDSPLWTLHARQEIPADERIAMAAIYDNVWVPAEHMPRVAAAFRSVAAVHDSGRAVCHLTAVADAMDAALVRGVRGVGFWGTSVAENPWVEYTPPADEDSDEDETWTDIGPDDPRATPINEVVPDLLSGNYAGRP